MKSTFTFTLVLLILLGFLLPGMFPVAAEAVTINDSNIGREARLNLLGDVTGDGKVTATDYSRLLAHVKKISLISDPVLLQCADVTGDGKVTATDYSRLLAHVKKVSPLDPPYLPEEEPEISMTYEKYIKLSAAEQAQFRASFESLGEFFDWYNAAKAEYDAAHPGIDVGDGSIDLEDIMNNNNNSGNKDQEP